MIYKSEKELEQENVEHFCLIIDLKRLTELDFLSIVCLFFYTRFLLSGLLGFSVETKEANVRYDPTLENHRFLLGNV